MSKTHKLVRSVHIGHEIIHTHAHLLNGIHIGGLYCVELEGLCVGGWVGGQVGKERESVLLYSIVQQQRP